jgi:hypothetical protein
MEFPMILPETADGDRISTVLGSPELYKKFNAKQVGGLDAQDSMDLFTKGAALVTSSQHADRYNLSYKSSDTHRELIKDVDGDPIEVSLNDVQHFQLDEGQVVEADLNRSTYREPGRHC